MLSHFSTVFSNGILAKSLSIFKSTLTESNLTSTITLAYGMESLDKKINSLKVNFNFNNWQDLLWDTLMHFVSYFLVTHIQNKVRVFGYIKYKIYEIYLHCT